ncbi:MAG: serine protease [Rhodospirillales bacterium]|nr:serine protease [Rhodospirillales bacterium]
MVFVGLLGASLRAEAQNVPVSTAKVGAWTVVGVASMAGYAYCTATSTFSNQTAFGFGITNGGRTMVVLGHPNFRIIKAGVGVLMDVTVGNRRTVKLAGVATGTGGFLFFYAAGDDEPPLESFRSGTRVRMADSKSDYRFDLEASEPAAESVERCHAQKGEVPGGTRPALPSGLYSGTGVIVSERGEIVTNAHVVRACTTIEVGSKAADLRPALLIASDDKNDLALLRATLPSSPPARLRDRPMRSGEDVVALGYPLSGLLAQEANVSRGAVTALAGIGDDQRFLQISAPIQPGNSGGPLFDSTGALAGLTTSVINAAALLRLTGAVPQNIGFALKSSVLRSFLADRGVTVATARGEGKLSPEDVGERGRKSTVLVRCKR